MIGIGVDAVEIERFRRVLERTPTMRERVFTPAELAYVAPKADPVPSLAARFAAREAVMKALGLGLGAFGFHDVIGSVMPSERPKPWANAVLPTPISPARTMMSPVRARPAMAAATAWVPASESTR